MCVEGGIGDGEVLIYNTLVYRWCSLLMFLIHFAHRALDTIMYLHVFPDL